MQDVQKNFKLFACFQAFFAEVTWPWVPTQRTIFASFFFKLGYNPSLSNP